VAVVEVDDISLQSKLFDFVSWLVAAWHCLAFMKQLCEFFKNILIVIIMVTWWHNGLASQLLAREVASSMLIACCVSSCPVRRDGLCSYYSP